MRRHCRRYCVARTSLLILILFSTISTMVSIHRYFSKNYLERHNQISQIYFLDKSDLEDAHIKPTKNIYLLHDEFFHTTRLACQYPKLTIDNQDIWKFLQPVTKSKPDCETTANWVYVDNGL